MCRSTHDFGFSLYLIQATVTSRYNPSGWQTACSSVSANSLAGGRSAVGILQTRAGGAVASVILCTGIFGLAAPPVFAVAEVVEKLNGGSGRNRSASSCQRNQTDRRQVLRAQGFQDMHVVSGLSKLSFGEQEEIVQSELPGKA